MNTGTIRSDSIYVIFVEQIAMRDIVGEKLSYFHLIHTYFVRNSIIKNTITEVIDTEQMIAGNSFFFPYNTPLCFIRCWWIFESNL